MDQDAYHRIYQQINHHACLFEKAILAAHCQCRHAHRFNLAEREGTRCRDSEAYQHCKTLLKLLSEQTRFVLKTTSPDGTLTHAQSIRLQVGGCKGLQAVLNHNQPSLAIIEDIAALISQAETRFGSLEQLPFQELIKQVATFKRRER